MDRPAPPSHRTILDAWNRLIVADDENGHVHRFEYDGLGRRIVRDPDGTANTIDYYYNESWQLVEERKDGSSYPLAQYVWHPEYVDALALRWYDEDVDGSGVLEQYSLHDAQYSVRAVTDDAGSVLERYIYTPYGQCWVQNGPEKGPEKGTFYFI